MHAYYLALATIPTTELDRPASSPVKRGFAELELHRRGKNSQGAWRAARVFADVLKNDKLDPWAHYGFAIALLREPRTVNFARTAGLRGGSSKGVAARQLNQALALDPDLPEAADLLASLGVSPTNPAMGSGVAVDTAAILARQPASAMDHLERATLLFAKHEDDAGAQAYMAGLAAWDSAAAETYLVQAAVIASRQEMIALYDGPLQKRADALRLFWKKRAVRDGISIPERIAEHYRRIAVARARYAPQVPAVLGMGGPGHNVWGKKRTGLEAEMDDRGLIYVRFGEPIKRIGGGDYFGEPLPEAWVYVNPNGRYTFYMFSDGRLESDVMRISSRTTDAPYGQAEFLYDLAKYDSRYGVLATRQFEMHTVEKSLRSPLEKQQLLRDKEEDFDRANDRLTQRAFDVLFAAFDADAARPLFEKQLVAFHDFATFRGNGCTDVVFSVAAPGPSYHVSVAVADTFTWESHGVDTRVDIEAGTGEFVRSTGVLCTQPDHNAYVRLTIARDSLTGVTAGGELRVPDYSGRQLMISDLLFATDTDGGFVRGRAHLALVPPRQFRQNQPFRVFYELYNLPSGKTYKTEITFTTIEPNALLRLFKGKSTTTVTFEELSQSDDVVQELRTLVPEVEPGKATITIKVTDTQTGQSASTKETIWILPAKDD